MATHPADKHASNPRIQCVVCGKWKRLFTKDPQPPHGIAQTFFGGCEYSGGDHLAQKDGDTDVCELCCHVACKAIAEARARMEDE